MDLVNGSEISFSDGFFIKPVRTFIVNTNAPLHSNGFDVPPSGGIATFPDSCNYSDRIFLWRAVGQKLYIEERSLIFSIGEGSLCIDFTRTSVIPGTSITIFEEGILSIVVPTASAIHRFYARLLCKGRDTFSILARIKEDDEFRRYQSSHSLSTPGRPIKASVTNHFVKNTIAYCTADGQLVVVQMGNQNDSSDKHEEYTIGEVGLLGKLLGGSDKRVSDACVMKTVRKFAREGRSPVMTDVVFAVTRDGWVQAWNTETRKQLPDSIDLNQYFPTEEKLPAENSDMDDESAKFEPSEYVYSIKAYSFDVDVLLIVGCNVLIGGKSVSIRMHILKMADERIEHLRMFETNISSEEKMIDFELIQTYFPPNEAELSMNKTAEGDDYNSIASAQFSLTALFNSSSAKKSYSMKRISFAIHWEKSRTFTDFDWHPVHQFTSSATRKGEPMPENEGELESERPFNLSADSSIETLIDTVFDSDLYSFDIVFRAVQIVSENFRGTLAQIRNNNWSELSKLVDTYLTSVEFNRKFQQKTDRSIRLRLNTPQESQTTALRDFWWALLRACEELDFAARGAIALAPLQLAGDVRIMSVIHKDRMTVLGDNSAEFVEILSTEQWPKPGSLEDSLRRRPDKQIVDVIEEASKFADRRVYLMNRERARLSSAKNGVTAMDDDGIGNAYDYEMDGKFLNVKTPMEAPIVKLAELFVQTATFDNSRPFGDPCPHAFGGTFTQSLVSANIRVTVETRVRFALTLRSLLSAISERKTRAGGPSFGDVEALLCELREIIRVYRELNEQLDLKIVKNGVKMSVCTWLTSDNEGLHMMKREGGYGPSGYGDSEIRNDDYNFFVGATTDAAVRALLSSSEILVLPRRLVMLKQYKVLLTILNSYISETRALKPVITFYRGIAYSGTEHPVKALNAFQSCLDAFTEGNVALRKAVFFLLPKRFTGSRGKDPIEEMGTSEYFLTVVRFLQEHGHAEEVCSVAVKAIENLPIENESVQVISNTLFNHLTNRREWFQALKLIIRTTLGAETRRASICELLTLMTSTGEGEAIATMKFGVHEQVVEDFLRDAAMRQSPSEDKHFFELLFAFYVARKDFRKAASVMYEYARHIETATCMTPELLRRRRDCLAAVLNLQSVLSMEIDDERAIYDDSSDTNLVFPRPPEEDDDLMEGDTSDDHLNRSHFMKGSTTSGSSPETGSQTTDSSGEGVDLKALKAKQMAFATNGEMEVSDENGQEERSRKDTKSFLVKRRKLLVLSEKDIRDEWVLCSARCSLISSEQYEGAPPTNPAELFPLLVDNFHFDQAFDVARQFSLNSCKLFFTVTREAILIDALRDEHNIEMATTHQVGWVRQNRRHCVAVASSEDHWAVVRGLVDAAQSEWPADSRPLRGATEAFLNFRLNVPFWLEEIYAKHDANDYIRCLVDYESYSSALQILSEIVEEETIRATKSSGSRTWIPYGVVDELMLRSADFVRKMAAKSAEDQILAAEVANLRKNADQKMMIYFRKIADFEQAQKMSSRFFEK